MAVSDRFSLINQALANNLPDAYARPMNRAYNDALLNKRGNRWEHTPEENAAKAALARRGASERFLPTYSPGGRLGPAITNFHANSNQRGQEMRTVDRPSVAALREERELRGGSNKFEVVYSKEIFARASDLPTVTQTGVQQLYVGPDQENQCSVVVAALPAKQEFLLIYGPTDGSQPPRKVKFMGQHTIDGLASTSHTFIVGVEAPATDRLIDPRVRHMQKETTPFSLTCLVAKPPLTVRAVAARSFGARKLV